MVSAQFGAIGANSVMTPGFNAEKKFSFACNIEDGKSEDDVIINVHDLSLEQSDVDDISSMASDFVPKFRAKRAKRSRNMSSENGMSGVSGTNSSSSSDMAAVDVNDDDVRAILRRHSVLRMHKMDCSTQTDLV